MKKKVFTILFAMFVMPSGRLIRLIPSTSSSSPGCSAPSSASFSSVTMPSVQK